MQPIKLITGLGNNEPRYQHTRHNIGFMWLDALCEHLQLTWQRSQHGNGSIAKWHIDGHTIILFKPGRLMNINGGPIIQCAQYHHIEPQHMLLAYDELDLHVGQVKLKTEGGHGGHNGVRDVLQHAKTANFYRLRFGIGRPYHEEVSHYVLGKIPSDELGLVQATIKMSVQKLPLLIDNNEKIYHQELAQWSKEQSNKE